MDVLNYQRIFHEIKNTVTLINSSIQLLDCKCPDLNAEPYWQNTKQEISYLKNIVLEISQTGNMDQLHFQLLDVNTLIKNCCHYMNDSFPDLEWQLDLSDMLPAISGDSTKLMQAILNILKNAAEAMNGKGLIQIQSQQSDAMVQIHISDQGGGIRPDLEDKIFDLFITSKQQGTGLGLAITKQLIEKHSGKLAVKNQPGYGCTFTLMLPIYAVAETA